MNRLLSVQELLTIAGRTSSKTLPIETATTLPLATMSQDKLSVVILYYKEIGLPGRDKKIYPPHHIMILDPSTGDIVRFSECNPKDFGLDREPDKPEMGYGLDPKMTGEEFQSHKRRFLEISPAVWEAFAGGRTRVAAKTKALIKEYHSIFLKIAKQPLMPYYKAAAPDFLDWLAAMNQ